MTFVWVWCQSLYYYRGREIINRFKASSEIDSRLELAKLILIETEDTLVIDLMTWRRRLHCPLVKRGSWHCMDRNYWDMIFLARTCSLGWGRSHLAHELGSRRPVGTLTAMKSNTHTSIYVTVKVCGPHQSKSSVWSMDAIKYFKHLKFSIYWISAAKSQDVNSNRLRVLNLF